MFTICLVFNSIYHIIRSKHINERQFLSTADNYIFCSNRLYKPYDLAVNSRVPNQTQKNRKTYTIYRNECAARIDTLCQNLVQLCVNCVIWSCFRANSREESTFRQSNASIIAPLQQSCDGVLRINNTQGKMRLIWVNYIFVLARWASNGSVFLPFIT